jgi:hypothetical protein
MGIGDKEMTIEQFMRRARGYARLAATRKDNVLERFVVWAGSHGATKPWTHVGGGLPKLSSKPRFSR